MVSPSKKIEIIGHRGARAYAPENTLAGYKEALAQGVDSIDVDVVVTADKVLLGYHDLLVNPDILCLTSGIFLANSKAEFIANIKSPDEYLIKNLTLSELKQRFRVRLNPKSAYAKFFPEQKYIPDTQLNTLQEIVDLVDEISNKSVAIQIEVKNSFDHPDWSYTPEELAQIVYNFILKNNLLNRVKVQAFDWRILAHLNQFEPTIKTAYLFTQATVSEWQRLYAHSIIMDVAENMQMKQLQFLPNLVKQLGGYSYEPEDNLLTYEDLKMVKKLGLKVFVWGWPENSGFVYNPELIIKLIGWQIDGFITDKPRDLRELLYKTGYPVPKQFNC